MEWNVNGRCNWNGQYSTMPAIVPDTILNNDNKPDIFVLLEYVPGSISTDKKERLETVYEMKNSLYHQSVKNSVLIGIKKEY